MEHHFNVDIAKDYGIEEAILLHNFYYWIRKNAVDGKNFIDGMFWTHNSQRVYSEYFPYLSESQVKRVVKNLIDKELIKVGNYNNNKFDKTNWYALTDKCIKYLKECKYEIGAFEQQIQNHTFDSTKSSNGECESEQCNNNYYNNTTTNTTHIEKEIDKSISKKSGKTLEERDECFKQSLQPYVEKYGQEMIESFYLYWSEPNKSHTKMKYEMQQTFDISRRLATWHKNEQKRFFSRNGNNKFMILHGDQNAKFSQQEKIQW